MSDKVSTGAETRVVTVPSATAGIVVSNPVRRKFVSSSPGGSPEVKVTITEQHAVTPIISTIQLKPRRSRKADLAKCLANFSRNNSSGKSPPKHFIILGDVTGRDTNDLINDSYSLPKFIEDDDKGAAVYVKCPECNKKLKQKSYRSHLRTHLGVKQFKCELCGDGFTRKNDVKRHTKLIHDKPRSFQCDICLKYFLSEDDLINHKGKHQKDFRCCVCNHNFGKSEYFDNHIKFVHPNGRPKLLTNELYNSEVVDNPEPVKKDSTEKSPTILRKSHKRKSDDAKDIQNNPIQQPKILMLGSPVYLKDQSKTDEVKSKPVEDNVSPKLGQLVQMEDGTYVIVNAEADTDDNTDCDEPSDNKETGSQV